MRVEKLLFHALLCGTSCVALHSYAYAQSAPIAAEPATPPPPLAPAPPPLAPAPAPPSQSYAQALAADIVVTATRLNAARDSIKPYIGASTYSLSNADIANLPGSENQPLNDIILQLPGVSQDGLGQFHVRDDHNGLQYRLNGVILPEGTSVFGQALSPHLIDKLDLITGAMPAQYGLRTAGVIDITTKSGQKSGQSLDAYGGSFGTGQFSVDIHGGKGTTTWFFTDDYRQNALGLENVNAHYNALHDKLQQFDTFGHIEHIIGGEDRLSLSLAYTRQNYQIPNQTGLTAWQTTMYGNPVSIGGVSQYLSDNLNETQLQTTGFGVASWLHHAGPFSLQANIFTRVSTLNFSPDILGGLIFNLQAQHAHKQDSAYGTQMEASYIASPHHVVRAGFILNRATSDTDTNTWVFATSPSMKIYGNPFNLPYSTHATQKTYSLYLQDEFRLAQHVTLNYGLRYDENIASLDEHQLSPRTSLVWKPNNGFTLHMGYARYFSPAPFELVSEANIALFQGTTGAVTCPAAPTPCDSTPKAQRENYYDVGFLKKMGRFTLGLDGYYRQTTHLLDEGQFGAPIILTPFNYDRGFIQGAELTLNYAKKNISAYANFSYAKALATHIISSQFNFAQPQLDYIAQNYIHLDHDQTWSSSGGFSYAFTSKGLKKLRVSGDWVYGSGLRKADSSAQTVINNSLINIPNGTHLPAYLTFNISANYKMKHGFEMRVEMTNLGNKIYEIRDGTGVGVGAPQYGARRGGFIGITKSF